MDTARQAAPATPLGTPPASTRPVEPSTGVMKALVLVDALREQRLAGDEARRANLMGRHRRS